VGSALGYAAKIYLAAGIKDTAFIYARRLAENRKSNNRMSGLWMMVEGDLIAYSPSDSVSGYIAELHKEFEKKLNGNMRDEALLQNTLYNYELHQREREKAEQSKDRMRILIYVISLIVLLLIILIVWSRYRNKSNLLKLHKALDDLSALQASIATDTGADIVGVKTAANEKDVDIPEGNERNGTPENEPKDDVTMSVVVSDIKKERDEKEILVERLRTRLLELRQSVSEKIEVDKEILESVPYAELIFHLRNNDSIPAGDPFWERLEEVVLSVSPDFKKNLILLSGGKIKKLDSNIACLIKCGISPTDITLIVGKTKGTVSYHREVLGIKAFGEKLPVNVVDDIIRAL